jgi:hypothetical protein
MKIKGVDVSMGHIDLSPDGRLTVIGCRFPVGSVLSIQTQSSDPACRSSAFADSVDTGTGYSPASLSETSLDP